MLNTIQPEQQSSLLERLAGFLNPAKYDTTYLTHGIHPYPAKYIPQLPREVILENSTERNTILDPFCGSGTTLLEASLLGRKSIGIDSNPIACLIARAKTQILELNDINDARNLINEINNLKKIPLLNVPEIPNMEHWFQPNVVKELAWLKARIDRIKISNLKDFLLCCFSSIIVSVSNQESETRYAAKNKNIEDGYVLKRFCKKLSQELKNIDELSEIKNVRKNRPLILNEDSRDIDNKIIPDNSIDLVVTSPPYPNSFDYYLYHKLRMCWLGYDPKLVKDLEIGSRNEHSSRKASIERYEEKMIPVLQNISRVLKPGKLAYFFVGDAIIANNFINIKEVFNRIANKAGLKLVADTEYSLAKVSRYFHEKRLSSNRNEYEKMQRVLIFEAIKDKQDVPTNRVIASAKSKFKEIELKGAIKDKSVIAIKSDDSNRHIHSLGKYPSKFFPEIPRWAINEFSNPGDTILDPFVGSGTTCVESMLLSRNSLGVDISPYACLLTEAKTLKVSENALIKSASIISSYLDSPHKIPKANRKSFEKDSFWFNLDYLEQIESIRQLILEEVPTNMQKFFIACLSTTIKPSSYLDESQIKVKRDAKKLVNGTLSPIELMKNSLPKYIKNLILFNSMLKANVTTRVVNASADNLDSNHIMSNSVDLIVTSPPYINAMNYPMTHRYENLLLDLVDFSENIEHQTKYFGTERVYSKSYSELRELNSSLSCSTYINPKLEEIYNKEKKRSYIAYNYFENMYKSFESCVDILKPGGKIVLVVGTNTIRGVDIDTFNILVSMLQDLGLKYHSSFHYEIIKNAFKLRRHETANLIKLDGVAVLEK